MNKAIVDNRLRPQSQWSRGKSAFLSLAYARPCDFSVGFPTSRHCLFTNNCHAHWHAVSEIRSGHEILARDRSARIIYVVYIVAWQTYKQTDCNTLLPLAGEVINPQNVLLVCLCWCLCVCLYKPLMKTNTFKSTHFIFDLHVPRDHPDMTLKIFLKTAWPEWRDPLKFTWRIYASSQLGISMSKVSQKEKMHIQALCEPDHGYRQIVRYYPSRSVNLAPWKYYANGLIWNDIS